MGRDKDDEHLEAGDKVAWNTSQGRTEGTVERRLTEETEVKGHTAKATEDDPQYLVKSDKSGAKAAHHPEALDKR